MGLRVRSASGGPAGIKAISARTVLRLIDVLPGFYLLGALVALVTGSRRRRIGDWAGGTIVVRDDGIADTPQRPGWRVALYPTAWMVTVLVAIFALGLGKTASQQELAQCDGCVGAGSTSARPPIAPGSVPMPNVSLPPGLWTANGTVLAAVNSADEPAGTKLVRPWTFFKVCNPSCRTIFLRQTLYGPSETVLIAHANSYAAAFPPVTVPCAHYPGEDAGTAESYDTYRLSWSLNHQQVSAVERDYTTGGSCGGSSTQTTSWVATRVNPTASAPGP